MFRNLLLLAARILIAVLFVPSGIHALSNIAGTTTYFGSLGFPLPMLVAWGVGLLEFVGGCGGAPRLPDAASLHLCLPRFPLPRASSATTAMAATDPRSG